MVEAESKTTEQVKATISQPEEEIKNDEGNTGKKPWAPSSIPTSDTPAWMSRSKRKRENKVLAKQLGMKCYQGGGYTQDVRWQKEKTDEDGNLERVSFLKKLKLASFEPLEAMAKGGRIPCPKC